MDALDLLEQQHRDVGSLLDRLMEEPTGATSEATLHAAIRAVEAHVRVEEAYVYVACAGTLRDRERIAETAKEHARILGAARSLLDAPLGREDLVIGLASLRALFAAHAEVEEDVVFPKLKRALTDEELDVLGEEIRRSFGRLMGEGEIMASPAPEPRDVFDGMMPERSLRKGPRRMAPSSA